MPKAPPNGVREKVPGKSQVLETARLHRLASQFSERFSGLARFQSNLRAPYGSTYTKIGPIKISMALPKDDMQMH